MFIEPLWPFLRHSSFVRTSISNCLFLVKYKNTKMVNTTMVRNTMVGNTMVGNTMVGNTIIEEYGKLIYNIIRFYINGTVYCQS